MPLTAGSRLGPYEIDSQLGAGGMGEVYRASDTRLGRTVAIKVLPEEVSKDAQRRQRLEREARAISSLSHPNICALYDIGHQDGTDFLVMEYIEGETLAHRLTKGPLPLDQVLRYGIEIAEALDKAHRQGIVHRDLKPGNIMLTRSGAKLLDFGLASMAAPPPGQAPSNLTALPTMTRAPLTAEGTIVGTFQYMAPEQLEGQEADARTDLFALGAVLYEMATGHRAFEAKSQASLIAAILSSEPPPIATLQPMSPPALDRVIKTCLAKDPENRWQTAHDVALQLKWIAEGGSEAGLPAPVAARRRSRERMAWAVAAAATLVAVAFAIGFFMRAPKTGEPIRFQIAPPQSLTFMDTPRISPNGKFMAFNATDSSGKTLVWIRPLSSLSAQPLPGTEGTQRVFWSPDSRYIAFFAGGKLKKVDVSGGPPQSLSDVATGSDGAWGNRGVIIFDGALTDSIRQVSAAGGMANGASRLDRSRGELYHAWPLFLPDGHHFLYLALGSRRENDVIKVGSLGSKSAKILEGMGGTRVEYAPPGYLLFVREGSLMARAFDTRGLKFEGEPFPIAEQVGTNAAGFADFSASQNGVLVYRHGNLSSGQLTWVDRSGKQLGTVGQPGDVLNVGLSPDGKRIAMRRLDAQSGTRDVWLIEIARGITSRFTFDPANDNNPLWSPDGGKIVFNSDRDGKDGDLFEKVSSGGGSEEPILKTPNRKLATDWSSDGRYILYTEFDPKTKFDVWALPTFGDKKPIPLFRSTFNEFYATFSPDGHWIAYGSDESGKEEIYVQAFPGPGGKWQVSTNGGNNPHWRHDGKEIFYIATDNKLMAVDVNAGASFEAGVPKPLFDMRTLPSGGNRYSVSADGQRFLVVAPMGGESLSPTTVIVNWTAGLKR